MSKNFKISGYEIKSTDKVLKALKVFDKNNLIAGPEAPIFNVLSPDCSQTDMDPVINEPRNPLIK